MEPLDLIVGYLDGAVSKDEFTRALYTNGDLERLLTEWDSPPAWVNPLTAFHRLLEVDFDSASDELNARDLLAAFIATRGIAADDKTSQVLRQRYDLLLRAQPRWLDAPERYLDSLLRELPEALDERTTLQQLKAIINERFRFIDRPPRWLQSPEWLFTANGHPALFIGQLKTLGRHDDAEVYVFLDEETGTHLTVVQVA